MVTEKGKDPTISKDEKWKIMWDILFNSAPESIIILSEDQTILDVNEPTIKLLGIENKEEIIGKKCYEVFHNSNEPPEGCPFLEMKERGWKTAINEMETIVGDFLVQVVPLEIPGEERKILHFARDVTLINQLGMRLIDSLQRYTSFLNTLIRIDGLMLREKHLSRLLNEVARVICENENFEASWILLKEGNMIRTVSKYGVDWNFEERYPGEVLERDEEIWTQKYGEENYVFVSLEVEDRFLGLIILLRRGDIEIGEDDIKALKIMADDLAITIRERRLEIGRSVAYRELEKNIENFAMLVDGIRNPLAVVMGIAETMVEDEEVRKRIIEQVEKIEEITYTIDKRWRKSEYLRKFLKNM